MPSKTFTRNKSTLLAKTGSTSLGGGQDSHLPVGTSGSYSLRGAVQFNLDWTDVTGITSATLHMQNTTFTHVDVGGTIIIRRITSGSWSPNSGRSSLDSPGGSGWSTSGADYDEIGSGTTTGQVTKNTPNGESDTWTADITDIVLAWAPSSIPGGGGESNYGIVLVASSGDAEMKSGYDNADPYITLVYTSNVVPDAPVSQVPAASAVVVPNADFSFTHSDDDGDAFLDWDLQIVDGDEGYPPVWASAEVDWAAQTAGISGNNFARNATQLGFTAQRGHSYYWRARTSAATGELGEGAWTSERSFTVASLPTASVTTPGSGHTAKLSYTAGDNTTPKLVVGWSYSDADVHAQQSVDIKVYSDSGGSPGSQFGTTYTYTGTAVEATIPLANVTPVEGTKYHVSVTPTCSFSQVGAESTKVITRTRWGRGSYYFHFSPTPGSVGTPSANVTSDATSTVVVEYALTGSTSEPSTWYATLAAAGAPAAYIWHRVTMFSWGSASPTKSSISDIAFPYNATVYTADGWDISGGGTIDTADYVYGTRSLKIAGDGTENVAFQTISGLKVGLPYILSARIASLGNSGAQVWFTNAGATLEGQTPDTVNASQTFGEVDPTTLADKSLMVSDIFYPTTDTGFIVCRVDGAGGTAAWFDAVKLEQSLVATPWMPPAVTPAVVMDGLGIGIDATAGGSLRLRDIDQNGVTMDDDFSGVQGIPVASDTEPSAPFDGMLWWDTDDTTTGQGSLSDRGTAFPGSPATDDIFYRTDLGMAFFYNGTRWLSTQLFKLPLTQTPTAAIAATAGNEGWTAIDLHGGSDLWVEDIVTSFFINAGTALSGSHKWVVQTDKGVVNSATFTALGATRNIDSGSSSVTRTLTTTVDALLNNGTTHAVLRESYTKTGTPGNIWAGTTITYRVVAT